MDMAKRVPWLDQPVMLHSSRKDTCKLTADQCAYRKGYWRYWYQADHVYALNTVYFFCVIIGVFAALHMARQRLPASLSKKQIWRRSNAIYRSLSYRVFEVKPMKWRTSPLGVILLGIVGFVFFAAMTLGPQPYYWPNTRKLSFGNSPPLATRTGWMALGCLPFMIMLSTKANPIAYLTGLSHDRLIIFHSFVGWAMMALGLLHTFPFIVFHIWKGDMMMVWRTSVVYWTGVVAVLAQAYLTFMSIPWIRNRYYEFFKYTHYLAAIVFMVFFFIHCDFRLTSWDYFIATGILWFTSFSYRHLRTYADHGISHKASLTILSPSTLQIVIPTVDVQWTTAQHIFLRFRGLGVHSLTSHPFTICSLPSAKLVSEPCQLRFFVSPRGGTTRRLAALARKSPGVDVGVYLDGPYGGLKERQMSEFKNSLIIAGGGGAGFTLPIILDFLRWQNRKSIEEEKGTKKMKVVIVTREQELYDWYSRVLNDMLEEFGDDVVLEGLRISVHITDAKDLAEDIDLEEVKKKTYTRATQNQRSPIPIQLSNERPNLTNLIRKTTADSNIPIGIAVCGPESMLHEVQNEAATAQLRRLGDPRAEELYLHSELFSW